ncbi:MAG: hypothetical protein LBK82_05455 [Planctomycetaceae bacterium]|jgi:hypothetical protein|nr:hypothetical protein [Planctomycetaceae bacterium]
MTEYDTLLAELSNADNLIKAMITNSAKADNEKAVKNFEKELVEKITNAVLDKLYGLLTKATQTQAVSNSSVVYGDQAAYNQAMIESAESVGLDIPSTFPVSKS